VFDVHALPAVNATLNGVCLVLLLAGLAFIRSGRMRAHRACMIAAFSTSILFLASYLVYHGLVGTVRFSGKGDVRTVYLWILATHTVLAAAVPVLAVLTLRRALRGEFARHRRLARWTWPIWVYVSVTGIVVYVMLYRMRW
jgi:uncharacterized membrane protein YozB (DUF420 family)